MSEKQLQLWGIQPEAYPDGNCDVEMKIKGKIVKVNCKVFSYYENLFGVDLLCQFNCRVDIPERTLTLGEITEKQLVLDYPYSTVSVNGRDTKVIVDTGDTGYIIGYKWLIEELNLPLEDISQEGYSVTQTVGKLPMEFQAHVDLVCWGYELFNKQYAVNPHVNNPIEPMIGLGVLKGCVLEFRSDGTWEFTYVGAWSEDETEDESDDESDDESEDVSEDA